jgi:hypothetical protein
MFGLGIAELLILGLICLAPVVAVVAVVFVLVLIQRRA